MQAYFPSVVLIDLVTKKFDEKIQYQLVVREEIENFNDCEYSIKCDATEYDKLKPLKYKKLDIKAIGASWEFNGKHGVSFRLNSFQETKTNA